MEKLVLNLVLSKLKGIDINELISEAQTLFAAEIAQLKASDSDGNAINDFEQVEGDLVTAFKSLSDAVSVIKSASAKIGAAKK
jgi:hypothetical protein